MHLDVRRGCPQTGHVVMRLRESIALVFDPRLIEASASARTTNSAPSRPHTAALFLTSYRRCVTSSLGMLILCCFIRDGKHTLAALISELRRLMFGVVSDKGVKVVIQGDADAILHPGAVQDLGIRRALQAHFFGVDGIHAAGAKDRCRAEWQ